MKDSKLINSSDQNENLMSNDSAPAIDYNPVHFIRCHSKKNDNSDVQTQLWQCAFEPDVKDARKTTSLVATCGGNNVCFIDVKIGEVFLKYEAKDVREILYALAWTSDGKNTFLVSGGTRYAIHMIHPASMMCFGTAAVKTCRLTSKLHINSLLFHPQHWNLLICGGSHGEIHICNMGNPVPPELEVDFKVLQSFSAQSEIFSMSFCGTNNMLLTGCEHGLLGFSFPEQIKDTTKPIEDLEENKCKFLLPLRNGNTTQDLVDSVEAVGDGVIAVKCALHGAIYLWSLSDALRDTTDSPHVRPTHILKWSQTDNYFMFIGVQAEASLICCGDDNGALWLYDLSSLPKVTADHAFPCQPVVVLPWPHLSDPHTDKRRKLSVDSYDIIIAKVTLSSDKRHIVAVTNNNMVCVWERVNA